MSQTSPNSPIIAPDGPHDVTAAGVVSGPSDENDPLSHLYKMSRTAGLGSGDYVAVNPVAVTSLVFGIASALVVVDSLFIVLPLVGLILGIIAWRQVRQSNGTQTGGLMAMIAIFLSLGFLGAKVGKEGLQSLQRSADKKQIGLVIDDLGKNLAAIDPSKTPETVAHLGSAYDLFDEAFKSRVTRERFDAPWLVMRGLPYYGAMSSLRTNGLLQFETDPRSGDLVCSTVGIAEFPRGGAARWSMVFRQLNGKWYIENIPDLFPAAAPQQPQQQGR